MTKRPDETIGILQSDFITGWVPIQQSTLTASQSSITLSSLPQNFRTLVIVSHLRSDGSDEYDWGVFQFNGDNGANYNNLRFDITATTQEGSGGILWNGIVGANAEGGASASSTFGVCVAWLPGYRLEDRHKRLLGFGGQMGTLGITYMGMSLIFGNWRSVAAITSIAVVPLLGNNWVSGSKIELYGVV